MRGSCGIFLTLCSCSCSACPLRFNCTFIVNKVRNLSLEHCVILTAERSQHRQVWNKKEKLTRNTHIKHALGRRWGLFHQYIIFIESCSCVYMSVQTHFYRCTQTLTEKHWPLVFSTDGLQAEESGVGRCWIMLFITWCRDAAYQRSGGPAQLYTVS